MARVEGLICDLKGSLEHSESDRESGAFVLR